MTHKMDDHYKSFADYSFSTALEFMKDGERVARRGWNGRDMWVARSPGNPALPAANFWSDAARSFANANGGTAEVLPCYIMKTADNKIVMGWLASQTDMEAEDWFMVD